MGCRCSRRRWRSEGRNPAIRVALRGWVSFNLLLLVVLLIVFAYGGDCSLSPLLWIAEVRTIVP